MNTAIAAITPVWNEPLGMIQQFINTIDEVRLELNKRGIGFSHFFLDDCALHLPEESSILARHKINLGLAQTLVDGYRAVCSDLKTTPDIVVRLDCQEHDPWKILSILDSFSHSSAQVIFLPVWYWTEKEDRPLRKDITRIMAEFYAALSPINLEVILSIYNQKFPLGYQAFKTSFLKEILPNLEKGLKIFQEKFGQPATWGFDLLAILLAAKFHPEVIDFMFGGWSKPWAENRGPDKIRAQQEKAKGMIAVAKELGC